MQPFEWLLLISCAVFAKMAESKQRKIDMLEGKCDALATTIESLQKQHEERRVTENDECRENQKSER